ncbi:LOW QUALITY PROTEIN: MLO protein homolog 1-like [Triticum urartu]|uniref:LOW QUALITY PROTEIN: MLO protein homolog 1-like n=1 Tax=Triticum urartu TaxID=4572 RepID=UPI0020433475|nr:LOW QUALITY PROTEIN: MLO protein homolog 1-like [Triticum urartu]
MAGPAGGRELPDTPTWAVALVCAVMILVSVAMEHALHNLGHWFHKRHKKAMGEALEKMKAELMLVGFISLLLTVAQDPISKICISVEAGSKMLPWSPEADYAGDDAKGSRRRLLWLQGDTHRRFLAAPAGEDVCAKQLDRLDRCLLGKVALMSAGSMHQLHIFIFVLAVFHVLYSVVTMALSRLKMKQWKKWESETASLEYQFANDPSRCRFTHQTTFVRRHLGLSSTPGVRWVVAFFRQFFGSVTKVDYLTLRQGFINAHLSQKSRFDFHKYIKRSLEDDFKVVVGISLKLWFVAVLILFLDFHGIGTLIWMSVVPLVILLWVGTKLEMVIMEMAQEIQDRESVVKGAPAVEPSNKYFWFDRPDWVLFLIHLTLFQNAFQMAHFVWTVATPDLKKCYHQKMGVSIAKVVLGVAAQIMCSYITFPLYALVTHMGSHMKRSVFNEQTAKALTNWRKVAKEKKKARDADMLRAQMSQGSSPVHLLHNAGARSDDPRSAPASPRAEKGGGGVQHPARRVPPCDGWRSASLPALDAHITGADFCFSTQR